MGRVVATLHCEDALHTTQVPAIPPAVMQTGVLAFLVSHSPLVPQARQLIVVLSQIGAAAPAQVVESTQPTQPVPARHCGLPAMCMQSVAAAHSTQVCVAASQREAAEVPQFMLFKQPTQLLVPGSQNGVGAAQWAFIVHCTQLLLTH